MNLRMKFVGSWGRLGMKYKLSDICEYAKGKIKVSALDENTYISTENMLPNKGGITKAASLPTQEQTQAFMKNDVLVSNIRPYFKKIWYATFDGGCSNDVLVFRAKDGVSSRFLHYVLADDTFFDYSMATSKGTKMPRGDKKAIMEYEVPELLYEDQCKIAGVLEVIDEKIDLNTEVNKNLQEQAQSLYENLIADDQASTLVSLADLMDYAGGSQPPASEFIFEEREGYVRFVQIRDYDNDSHITYIPVSSRNKLCEERDIMIARYGASLGRICAGINGAYNVALAKVFPKQPHYREFLRCYLSSRTFYEGINNRGGRSAQAGFNQSDINSFLLAVPSDEKLHQFESIASALFEQRLNLQHENQELSELRDTLLPKLMSGEIDTSAIDL